MKEVENTWRAWDGAELFARGWLPAESPRAVIGLVHGLGEHSGRYQHVAAHFTQAGYAVQSFDLRGHGKTPGARGHASSIDQILQDIDLMLEKITQSYNGLPRFLYGHSLGGLLVLNYALHFQAGLAGVVATAPGFANALQEQKTKILLVRVLSAILPKATLPTGLDANLLSRDPMVVQQYLSDPLVHDRASLGFAKSMLDMVNWVVAHAQEFRYPLLLSHGTSDKLAYARGSQEFARLVPGNVTLKLWEGLSHETHNEPEKEQVLQYLLGWMDQQLILRAK
jgi:acylglycerol lipase